MGNMWDLDTALHSERTGKWDTVHDLYFFKLLFKSSNKRFVTAYKRKWNELKSVLFEQMDAYLIDYANSEECNALDKSLVLDRKVYGKNKDSVGDVISNFRQWFSSRQTWVDKQMSQLKGCELGDVNCDSKVNKTDLDLIIDYLMGKIPEGAIDIYNADINQDKYVNAADIVVLIKRL